MSLRLSNKHGVNPSVTLCFYCQKDKGIVLFGQLPNDAEAPRQVTIDKEPCAECVKYMEQGILFISVDASKSDDMENPWRTGGWVVLAEVAVKRIVSDEALCDHILKRRVCFIEDEVWDRIGLPRETKTTEGASN